MDKNEEILHISKLVFDLTLWGASGGNLDDLLGRLFTVLENVPGIRIQHKGAILLYNPRKELVQVAQFGLPPAIGGHTEKDGLDGLAPEYWSTAYVTSLSAEKALRKEEADHQFIVLPLAEEDRALGLGIIYLQPDWHPDPVELQFMNDLSRAISGLVTRILVNQTLRVRELELEEARTDAIRRLGVASEYRDNETGMHIMRMTNISVAIARAMGLPIEDREVLSIAAPMHDVGKIGIADAILLKPGKLTPEEFEIMKAHAEIGSRILSGEDSLIKAAQEIALYHHENWDGSGYPNGLKGEEIPLLARICALADVFDALTSERPYKEAWPVQRAVDWVRMESGKKFDPAVVAAFDEAFPVILRIRELYRDEIIDPNAVIELPETKPVSRQWVAWDESLRIGIGTIDAHHQFLVELINDLYDIVVTKRGAREVGRVLKALDSYVRIHFKAEERMMEHYGFDGLDRQHHQHERFTKKLQLFYEELHENPLTAPIDILTYLCEWLVRHIRHEDAQLARLVSPA